MIMIQNGLYCIYPEPPIITEADDKVLVASGDNATLVCLANGIPMPKITWFRGDVQVS